VLAWRLSNTMDVGFCLAALEEALARFGKPEIFNTDQGRSYDGGDNRFCRTGRSSLMPWRRQCRTDPSQVVRLVNVIPITAGPRFTCRWS
jgi:transposase InsO family protein